MSFYLEEWAKMYIKYYNYPTQNIDEAAALYDLAQAIVLDDEAAASPSPKGQERDS